MISGRISVDGTWDVVEEDEFEISACTPTWGASRSSCSGSAEVCELACHSRFLKRSSTCFSTERSRRYARERKVMTRAVSRPPHGDMRLVVTVWVNSHLTRGINRRGTVGTRTAIQMVGSAGWRGSSGT